MPFLVAACPLVSTPSTSSRARVAPLLLGLVAAGCGGKVVFDDGSGGAGVTAGSSSDVHPLAATASTASTASAGVTETLSDVQIFVDCARLGASDLVEGSFTVRYVNEGSSTITEAISSVYVDVSTTTVTAIWLFRVDPGSSGPLAPGAELQVVHHEIPGSGEPGPPSSPDLCAVCDGIATLHIAWQNGTVAEEPLARPYCKF